MYKLLLVLFDVLYVCKPAFLGCITFTASYGRIVLHCTLTSTKAIIGVFSWERRVRGSTSACHQGTQISYVYKNSSNMQIINDHQFSFSLGHWSQFSSFCGHLVFLSSLIYFGTLAWLLSRQSSIQGTSTLPIRTSISRRLSATWIHLTSNIMAI